MKLAVVCLAVPIFVWFGTALNAEVSPPNTKPQSFRRPHNIPYPAENPYSRAKAELGRMLFFDPLLSGSKSRSCATCHNPGLSWGDGLPKAVGENQVALPLRAPTLIDVAWIERFGWDGKFNDLESVAFAPISGKGNMNLPDVSILIDRLTAIPGYVQRFHNAFGSGGITKRNIELALATYERSIVAGEAPFDRWIEGQKSAISEDAKRGFALFTGKARCSECHNGPSFTDGSFHDIGVAQGDDVGRARLFPNSEKLRYAFKTPTLRNVALRAPYMHDGSIAMLEDVIDLYDKGGTDRPSRAEAIRPLNLTGEEKKALVAFLRTLTEKPSAVSVPPLPR